MPVALRLLLTSAVGLVVATDAVAQAVAPRPADQLLDSIPAATAPAADPLIDPTPLLVEAPTHPVRDRFRVAVDLGLPTGVRLQTRLFDTNIWAEAGVGAWVIVPYFSTCLRYDCTLLRRQRNLFAVRPGVSATLIGLGPNFGTGVDAEFVWQHRFHRLGTSELGVRLGVTAVFLNGSRDWSSGTFPAPVLALHFAWQY